MCSGFLVVGRRSPFVRIVAVLGLSLLVACRGGRAPDAQQASAPPARPGPGLGPADSLIPTGPLGTAIRRGRALLVATRDSLPRHVGNNLRCVSCHLDEGRRAASGSWVGVYARYPQYRPRSATVETIEYRVNDCFRRSMNGVALATDGPDMRDIAAYLWFLSRDVPIGASPAARRQPWAGLTADTAAGATVFTGICAKCHAPDGQGTAVAPPVWGARSYNIGAGMTRVRTAAAFIRESMPFDQPGTLTDQQALDVAAYVNAHPRPDFPDKINDWPNGDAPADAAYPTRAERRLSPHQPAQARAPQDPHRSHSQ
jgi:thiosulfate dehydrogenase